ncbi:MAG: phosphate/phosphite/phosphonate ABC transporter substrate-binding protein [Gammaproteobacteria bacterium]|nr:phosphate/phosphite/phosphonate ABC transporter substrate-binding protein [Gammaproteobacteria bacterium]
MGKIFKAAVLTALWALMPLPAGATDTTQTVYSFGIVPQQSATRLARLWVPLLDYLSEKTGIPLRFATAPNIPAFEQRLAAGEYDLAYMNPYHYTVFHRSPGYVAFARAGETQLRGLLVVRADSPVASLAALAGQRIAFPAPAAFAASVLPRAHLKNAGIDFEPAYVESHDSVYRSVAKGLYSAGGGVERTLNSIDPEIRDQLRILWTTDGYTPHAFAANPNMPIGIVDRLQHAMATMHEDEQGRRLLDALRMKSIVPAHDSDWNDVRALGIQLLDELVRD